MTMATAPEVDKIAGGPPSPFTDYYKKLKRDGGTTSTLTNTQLKESGAGFWADMAKKTTVIA
jgi:hypothetical protein